MILNTVYNPTPSFTNVTSTVATGTSPYACTSTTLNTNLNADLLDGQHGAYYQVAGSYQPLATNLTSIAGMAATVGLVKQTSANTFGIDATAYYKSGDSPTFAGLTLTAFSGFLKASTGTISAEAFGTSTYIPYSSGTGFSYSANLTFDGTNLTCLGDIKGLTHTLQTGTYITKLSNPLSGFDVRRIDAAGTTMRLYPYAAGTAEATQLLFFGKIDSFTSATAYHYMTFSYSTGLGCYRIGSLATGGTGYTVQPLRLYCGSYTTQLVLNIDGSITTSGVFSAGNGAVSSPGGTPISLGVSNGIVTAVTTAIPCADGVYTPVVSITTKGGIITAIT